jgi:hypothetical protein
MSHFRITILGMVGLVAMLGFWLASLMAATPWWTSAASTVTLAILLSSLLAAYHFRGLDRAYWSGFALFGITYLILVNWDWIGGQFGHDLTGGLSEFAETVLSSDPRTPTLAPGMGAPMAYRANEKTIGKALELVIRRGNFVQIGRMGLTLFFAIVGGLIARFLAARGAQIDAGSATIDRGADGSLSPARNDPPRPSS